jgi:hypothetical protein
VPVDEATLSSLVEAARLSTPQLESICQSVLGASITSISSASAPADQARDMVTYAKQYGLQRQLAAAIIYTGADRAGLQNLLLGNEAMVNQTEDQRTNAANSFDIVRLENRVERLSDKLIALEHKVDSILQRTPLNWNIVAWGIAIAILAGSIMWFMATVN